MRKAFPWVGRGRKSQALAEVSEARYAGRGAGGGARSLLITRAKHVPIQFSPVVHLLCVSY